MRPRGLACHPFPLCLPFSRFAFLLYFLGHSSTFSSILAAICRRFSDPEKLSCTP